MVLFGTKYTCGIYPISDSLSIGLLVGTTPSKNVLIYSVFTLIITYPSKCTCLFEVLSETGTFSGTFQTLEYLI